MNKPWPDIVEHYQQYTGDDPAIRALQKLSERVAGSPLASGIFGWTSMFDLCIAQTEVTHAYQGPYLKISPKNGGLVEFRYIDTQEGSKQWSRTEESNSVEPRLLGFFSQLGWFAPGLLRP